MQTSTLALLGGGLVAVSVAAAVYLRPIQDQIRADRAADQVSVVPQGSAPEPEAEVPAEDPVTAQDAGPTATPVDPEDAPVADEVAAEEIEPEQEVALNEPVAPALTTLRFEPDGAVLVSGTADPLSQIAVMMDGAELERLQVGADGTFFYAGFLGFSDGPRVLSVVGDPDGMALAADRTFVLAANPAPEPEPELVAEPEPQPEVVAALNVPVESAEAAQGTEIAEPVVDLEPDPTVSEPDVTPGTEETSAAPTDAPEEVVAEVAPVETDGTEVPAASQTPVVADVEPAEETALSGEEDTTMAEVEEVPTDVEEVADAIASSDEATVDPTPPTPAILAVTEEGVDVVQAPVAADASPEVMSTVALDTITYDASGDVQLRGRALGQGFVQVYVDNAPVSRLPVDETGRWRGDLPDVDKGVYTLRIDEIDATGDVVSRIETPFLREDPDTVAEVMAEEVDDPTFTVATRTVQPGATLWAIAEERYGAGVLYVTVFEANRDRIRNPDLIYPGQVFVLPEGGNE